MSRLTRSEKVESSILSGGPAKCAGHSLFQPEFSSLREFVVMSEQPQPDLSFTAPTCRI